MFMAKEITCGTLAGYRRHGRLKEPTCADCRAANSARKKEYYKENQDKIYAINRAWAARNPEKVKEFARRNSKKYVRKRNGPRQRSDATKQNDLRRAAKRRAIRLSLPSEPYTLEQVLKKYGTDCFICKAPIDLLAPRTTKAKGWETGLHLDHWIPLSKGGPDTLDNIRPTHGLCNIRKGDK